MDEDYILSYFFFCFTYDQTERPDVLTIAQDPYLSYLKRNQAVIEQLINFIMYLIFDEVDIFAFKLERLDFIFYQQL
ncbi:hypothetical protein IEQ34_018833 [Dendrobium chrysotoxum]|uniref:Uncharacterized protein n=1 Tax=Dendrobium chrysotoxum TaxID=161865 RepID=A0AAV7G774_DENCH|nr:hypothetical protein IEQ34_018833 [Dendrobium chrysotoxum]